MKHATCLFIFFLALCRQAFSQQSEQQSNQSMVERGSQTAKDGFRNEEIIRDKFNDWSSDLDAREWLQAMSHDPLLIDQVVATKLHAEKADIEVRVRSMAEEKVHGISIKLVSNANGFNQIDKRWLSTYSEIWKMPPDVVEALRLFVGEVAPDRASRNKERMFLDELDPDIQKAIVEFFTTRKLEIVSDLISGDGLHKADWMMVTLKTDRQPVWLIRSSRDVVDFFAEGPVQITKAGNLKIGRITMQRKGGDNGRETAKMLQFKLNPKLLIDAKPAR